MNRNTPSTRFALTACACLAVPLLAAADSARLNAQAIGVAESALNYCTPLAPAAAEKIRQFIKVLTQGASEKELVEVRGSDEYRQAYDSASEFAGKVDPHNAKKFCTEAAGERH